MSTLPVAQLTAAKIAHDLQAPQHLGFLAKKVALGVPSDLRRVISFADKHDPMLITTDHVRHYVGRILDEVHTTLACRPKRIPQIFHAADGARVAVREALSRNGSSVGSVNAGRIIEGVRNNEAGARFLLGHDAFETIREILNANSKYSGASTAGLCYLSGLILVIGDRRLSQVSTILDHEIAHDLQHAQQSWREATSEAREGLAIGVQRLMAKKRGVSAERLQQAQDANLFFHALVYVGASIPAAKLPAGVQLALKTLGTKFKDLPIGMGNEHALGAAYLAVAEQYAAGTLYQDSLVTGYLPDLARLPSAV